MENNQTYISTETETDGAVVIWPFFFIRRLHQIKNDRRHLPFYSISKLPG